MPAANPTLGWNRTGAFLAFAALVAVLALARDFLVPLALAGLFGFLLAPLAHRLERLHVPRALAALVSVLVLAGAVGGLLYTVGGQAVELTQRLPTYRENILRKVRGLSEEGGIAAPLARAKENLEALRADTPESGATGRAPGAAPSAPPVPVPAPVPVAIVDRDEPGALSDVTEIAPSVLGALGACLIVLVLTTFFVLHRADLRDRMIRLASRGDVAVTTHALTEASSRI